MIGTGRVGVEEGSGTVRRSLRRAIGPWSLVAPTINGVVGAGNLGLPGRVFALAGTGTGWVLVSAALLALAAAFCLAELGSRFEGAGGPIEYCRAAFGPVPGFVAGWLARTARFRAVDKWHAHVTFRVEQ